MELPVCCELDGEALALYPITLGQAYLISRHREGMADNFKEIISRPDTGTTPLDYRMTIARIVAIASSQGKDHIIDTKRIRERAEWLNGSLDDDDLFRLYDIIMASLGDAERFIEESGLSFDRKRLAKIAKYKETEGTFSFGGRTPYGSIIDRACERYGWTLDYVVWGISLTNLEMLLADEPSSVFLSKEDRKKIGISADREIIRADDPVNSERIRKMFKEINKSN